MKIDINGFNSCGMTVYEAPEFNQGPFAFGEKLHF